MNKDYVGQKFHKLLVVSIAEQTTRLATTKWECLCDCGKTCIKSAGSVKYGSIRSCGCTTVKHVLNPGDVFGRLTVIEYVGRITKNKPNAYRCICECKNEMFASAGSLVDGSTKSCGCLRSYLATIRLKEAVTKHGHSRLDPETGTRKVSPTYSSYHAMKARCSNPKNSHYHLYGGRGIKVCDRWKDDFSNFLADMGEKPSQKHSIDRIDNNKGYEPSNCRWATIDVQANNQRKNVFIEIEGERKTIAQWAEDVQLDPEVVRMRMKRGIVGKDLLLPAQDMAAPVIFVTRNGETKSLYDWCEITGIPFYTVRSRMKIGVPEEEWFIPAGQRSSSIHNSKTTAISVNGETKTIAEWARIYKLDAGTLGRRIKEGWPQEKWFTPARPKKSNSKKP